MSTSHRFLSLGLAVGLVAGALVGAGAVLARGPAGVPHAVAQSSPAGFPTAGVSAHESGSGTAVSGVTGISTGSAIAYPAYPAYPGSAGVAPDHTIVVTGVGQASLGADGSGRAEAAKTALTAALADAKAQADLIAATLGISIVGVMSVSSSVGDYGPIYPVPMMGGATSPGAPVPAPTDGVSLPQLNVSVTVAYGIS